MIDIKNKLPNFFIVGLPKAGTTALYTFLKKHPEVYLPDVKEPYFFSRDFHNELDEFYKKKSPTYLRKKRKFPYRNFHDYEQLFSEVKNEKAIGEASVHYIFSEVAAELIHDFKPDSKIIICLRNPFDFIRSWFQWNKYIFLAEGAEDLEEALQLENKREQGYPEKVLVPPVSHLRYLHTAKYSIHINRYIELFPSKNIKIVLFEDFKKDSLGLVNDLFKFLEVDPEFDHRIEKVNKSFLPRSILLRRFLDSPPILWLRNLIKDRASTEQFKLLKKVYDSLFNKKDSKVELSDELKTKIKKKLVEDVISTDRLLKRNNLIDEERDLVSLWNFK
jgi:hypothetical protein